MEEQPDNKITDFIKAILILMGKLPPEGLISPDPSIDLSTPLISPQWDPTLEYWYEANKQQEEEAARRVEGMQNGTIPTPTPFPAIVPQLNGTVGGEISPTPGVVQGSSTVDDAINRAAEKYAPGNEEFRLILHTIAQRESGKNPNAVGDDFPDPSDGKIYKSYGLFQNRVVKGRGGNYSEAQLKDPYLNSEIAAADLINYYNTGIKRGLSGPDLASFMERYGQKPKWTSQLDKDIRNIYTQYSKGVKQTASSPKAAQAAEKYPEVTTFSPQQIAQPVSLTMSPARQPSAQNPYTVKSGDTLWGLADKNLGGGQNWKQIQGYTGDPRKLPVGQKLTFPTAPQQNKPANTNPLSSFVSPTIQNIVNPKIKPMSLFPNQDLYKKPQSKTLSTNYRSNFA